MKPVLYGELERVIQKIMNRLKIHERYDEPIHSNTSQNVLKVKALGGFNILVNQQEEAIRWSTAKCKELLAYMLLNKESLVVSKWKLIDILWPGKDDEKSAINLRSTICRLNKTLRECGIDGRVIVQKNGYQLEINPIEMDLSQLESISEKGLRHGEKRQLSLHDFYEIYPGELFENEGYEWCDSLRIYYLRLFLQVAKESIDGRMERQEDYLETYQMIEYLLQLDPFNEDLQERALMLLYELEGKKSVSKSYDTFEKYLLEEIGVTPKKKLKDVYMMLMEKE